MEQEKPMIISTDSENLLTKCNIYFNKNCQKLGIVEKENLELASYLMVKEGMLSIWEATKQRYPLLPFLLNIVLEVLASGLKQEKEVKCIQIEIEDIIYFHSM